MPCAPSCRHLLGALLVAGLLTASLPRATSLAATGPVLLVGAAVGDFTPPRFGAVPGGDPANCIAGTPVETVMTGPRSFAYTEPYADLQHSGHYDAGDPFVDCNGNGRWDGNFIGGGGASPRFATTVADPTTARAIVVSNGTTVVGIEVLDLEGIFDVYQDRIRAKVERDLQAQGRHLDFLEISATHDESAPDVLGLYGVNQATSSVDAYEADHIVAVAADTVERAVASLRPATLRFAEALEPANLRQCWSSYPFVDDQLMPILQAVATSGEVIATLASVSQHAETLGFNPVPDEATWYSADWPYWFRRALEARYGGIAVEMAGSVGSVETPEVFARPISRVPERFVDEPHPAGCRTLFTASDRPAPLGYFVETRLLGTDLAAAVADALDHHAVANGSSILWGARKDVCIPVTNVLFLAGAAAGIFAARPAYGPGCAIPLPVLPNGSTAGTSILTRVGALRIGDMAFLALPGEVFPVTYLRGFLGPQDMPVPDDPLPPWLVPDLHTPFRAIDGLAEDMIGYIFPRGNGVGVPGEDPLHNPQANDTDRFGCSHSDDAEAASSSAADLLGVALDGLLRDHDGPPEDVVVGRYVLPDGRLSRDPLGGPEVKCSVDTTFSASPPAVAVWTSRDGVVVPASWMTLSGRPQAVPDRTTRGWIDAGGTRHWLDVFPDIAGAPGRIAIGSGAPAGVEGATAATVRALPTTAATTTGAPGLALLVGFALLARRRRLRVCLRQHRIRPSATVASDAPLASHPRSATVIGDDPSSQRLTDDGAPPTRLGGDGPGGPLR